MSAFGGKADIRRRRLNGLLLTQSGHGAPPFKQVGQAGMMPVLASVAAMKRREFVYLLGGSLSSKAGYCPKPARQENSNDRSSLACRERKRRNAVLRGIARRFLQAGLR